MDTQYRILDGDKLRKARGDRSLNDIASAANNEFTIQMLSYYENKTFFPRPEKVPALLKAYNTTWELVSSVFEVASKAA